MDFTLHTLGCGSAKPSVRHNPSCTVLDIRGTLYMIDCGEGAQQMFQRQRLKFTRLRHIFLTHLHGDHWLGLPGLLSTLSLTKCTGTVTVHTFKEGIEVIKPLMDLMGRDMSYNLEFHEIAYTDTEVFSNDYLTIDSLALCHKIPSVGYLFKEKARPRHINSAMTDYHKVPYSAMQSLRDGMDYVKPDGTVLPNAMLTTPPTPSVSYAHISDTAYIPDLAARIGSVDLLLHESTYLQSDEKDAQLRGHSTALQAAMVARDAGASRLLLTHFSSRYKNEDMFTLEAKEIFPNSILNREGLTIKL